MAHLGLEEPLSRKRRSEGSAGVAGDLAGAGDMSAKRLNLDLSRGLGGSLEDPSTAERDASKEALGYEPLRSTAGGVGAADAAEEADASDARGFAGLQNQGATCYMNSLLQTLFMTPEFRRLMYSWKYDEELNGEAKDCIPLQLQTLFGTLQLTSRRAVGTTALTKSFQWTSSDAFRQHDVQELMRVLLDALERALRASGHPTPTAVNDLFRGVYNDYIRTASAEDLEQAGIDLPEGGDDSLPEGAQVQGGLATRRIARSQNAEFMDLSLVIKPFGAAHALRSVEESLTAFIASEVMAGSNKVQFDELGDGVRVPAVKGLKVTKPPYILTLQLKRFDLDLTSPTLARIKLNDRVSFPILLNFNQWVGKEGGEVKLEAEHADKEQKDDVEDAATAAPAAGAVAAEGASAAPVAGAGGPAGDGEPEGDEGGLNNKPPLPPGLDKDEDYGTFKARAHQVALRHGPYVYELYAVLVHSGSALGGHYYVYIRDLDSGQWRNFNDSSVSDIDVETVKGAFGGSASGSLYASSASAYMLVYRRMTFEDVPVPEPEAQPETQASGESAGQEAAAAGGGGPDEQAETAQPPAAPETDGEVAAAAAAFGVSRGELLSGRSARFPPRDAVPPHVQEAMDQDVARELQAELERNRAYNTVKLNVRFGERLLQLPAEREQTVADITREAWRLLGLRDPTTAEAKGGEGGATEAKDGNSASAVSNADVSNADDSTASAAPAGGAEAAGAGKEGGAPDAAGDAAAYLPLDCVRLREYRMHNKSLGQPYDGARAAMTVGECAMYTGMQMVLETRSPGGEFPEFDPQAVTIKVRKYLRGEGDFTDAHSVSIRRSASLAALKRAIAAHTELGVPVEHQRVLKMSKYGTGNNMNFTLRVLAGEHLALGNSFFVGSGSELYVEDVAAAAGDADDFDPFGQKDVSTPAEQQATKDDVHAQSDSAAGDTAGADVAEEAAAAVTSPIGVSPRDVIMDTPRDGVLASYKANEGLLAIDPAASAAVASFKSLAHRVRVRYRLLDAGASKEEGAPFYIDMRSSVGELRAAVAQRLSVSPERLLLDKVHESHTVGMALKDDKQKLEHLYFMPTTVLMTREGQRLQPGEVNVKLSLYTPSHPNGYTWPTAPDVPVMDSEGGVSWVSYGGWAPKPMTPADRARIPVTGKYPDEEAEEGDGAAGDAADTAAAGAAAGNDGEDSGAADTAPIEGTASTDDAVQGAAKKSAPGDAPAGEEQPAAAAAAAEDWRSSAPYPEPGEMTFEALGKHPLSLKDDVESVKAVALQLLVKGGRVEEDCSLRRLRLRQKPGLRPGRILPDHTKIGDMYTALYEHMELQVEIVPREEEHICGRTKREQLELQATLADGEQSAHSPGAEEAKGEGGTTAADGPGSSAGSYASAAAAGAVAPPPPPQRTAANDMDFDDLLLVVQWLDLPRHKLCVPREIKVLKKNTVAEAIAQCAELAGVPAAGVQWVLHTGGKIELWHMRNQPWQLSSSHTATSSFRAKYSQDGALLLLRDSRQPRRELSQADMAALNPYTRSVGNGGVTSRLTGTVSAAARYRPKETGIKITVKGEAPAPASTSASAASDSTAGGAAAGASATASGAGAGTTPTARATITPVSRLDAGGAGAVSCLGKTEAQVAMEQAVRAQLRAEAAESGEGEEVIAYGGEGLFDVLDAFGD